MIFRRSSDLPLDRDASSRYLPWTIAFMAYLAALALAGTMLVSTAVSGWRADLSGTLTALIPAAADGKATEVRLAAAARLLRETKGVAAVEILDEARTAALLAPWLGRDTKLVDLPLPRLIDVSLKPDAKIDLAALRRRLSAAVPGAMIDDHGALLGEATALAGLIEFTSATILLLTILSAVAAVVFAARTSLALHQRVIELLHVIGARDSYVARQFHTHAFWLGLKGGVFGLALAALTLFALGRLAGEARAFGLAVSGLAPTQWAVLATVPLVTAVIAMLTARLTVLRALARMP
ncbi:MAG: FtsX-like permease family protein [Alphaproteobacteria bacterium]